MAFANGISLPSTILHSFGELRTCARDRAAVWDDATADLMDEWLARDYSALGYSVVRVPVLSPEERLAFVLERLSEQGLT